MSLIVAKVVRIITVTAIVLAVVLWILTVIGWLMTEPGFEPVNVFVSAILSSLIAVLGWLRARSVRVESPPASSLPEDSEMGDQIGVVIRAETAGKIDWGGDVLQDDSTKVVIERVAVLEDQSISATGNVEKLINDIQPALYGDDSRLPYVLTLCLDLCERVGLSSKYETWLRKELNGFGNYQGFQGEFEDEHSFEAWMQEWASHRLLETYIKVWNRPPGRARGKTWDFPYEKVFVVYSVAEIARMIQIKKESGEQEFSISLLSLGTERFADLRASVAEMLPEAEIPPDLQVFFNISGLEKCLNGVRDKVLSLLSEVRRQMGKR